MKRFLVAVMMLAALMLAACGNGGGGTTVTPVTPPVTGGGQVKGIAAKGAVISNASVQVLGLLSSGTPTVKSTTTDGTGSYTVDMSGVPGPYLVRVNSSGTWYYSSNTVGIANVNPYSDIIIRAWYKVHTTYTVDTDFATMTSIPSTAAITTIDTKVQDILSILYPLLEGSNLGSVISSSWTVGSGYDSSLDAIGPNFLTNMKEVIDFVAADPDMFSRFLLRSGVRTKISSNGTSTVVPILHSEIFINQASMKSGSIPTLSCPSASGNFNVTVMVIDPTQSVIANTYDIYVPMDSVSKAVTGPCSLTITKVDNSQAVFSSAPVIGYTGTGVTSFSLTNGSPVTVSWTNPSDMVTNYTSILEHITSTNATTFGTITGTSATLANSLSAGDIVELSITGSNGELADVWKTF